MFGVTGTLHEPTTIHNRGHLCPDDNKRAQHSHADHGSSSTDIHHRDHDIDNGHPHDYGDTLHYNANHSVVPANLKHLGMPARLSSRRRQAI